jgi:hypothetical protein
MPQHVILTLIPVLLLIFVVRIKGKKSDAWTAAHESECPGSS